jgi:ABC-type glycerol-3-phosphate transport system permease component
MMKRSSREILLSLGRWAITFAVAFMILFPLYWIFISSITPPGQLFNRPIDYVPDHPTVGSYIYLIKYVGLFEKLKSTLIIIGFSLILSTGVCILASYGFCRFKFRSINLAFAFIMASMLIPEVATTRPLYDFIRKVGLFDTFPGLIILYISGLIPFSVIVLTNFVREIPLSLEEAAAIDGAGFMQILFKITIPLMKPAIATICIINFISCLNNFFTPLYYSNRISVLSTAITQLPLRDNMYSVPWDLVSAMGWIIIFPIIIFVAIFERRIMDGIMAGGIKS